MKVLLALALAVLACRVFLGRWPWELLSAGAAKNTRRAGPVELEVAKARVLLGVREGASRDEVIEAHRKLVVQVHPDRGGTSELVHEANAARDLLLDELAIAHAHNSTPR